MTQSNQRIDLTAAEWAVRLHAGALTAEEQAELDRWLAADSRHPGALLRARAAWVDLDRLSALAGHAASLPSRDGDERAVLESASLRLTSESTNCPSLEGDSPPSSPPASPRSPRATESNSYEQREALSRPARSRRGLIAASVAALLCGVAGTWWAERRDRTYVSQLGQIRRVTLADGSRMILNTATEATVRFDRTHREIELASGEGLFQVAKDPTRPFVVRAAFVSVRAVGTVFAVRTLDERVDVTVTEGVVELMNETPSGSHLIRRVSANEHASIMETRQVEIQSIPHGEAERKLAWREGMVDFAGESLATAVAEMNRHNRRHILVDDAILASRPVVGLFRADDPEGFAATVAAALKAQHVDQDDAIHLRLDSSP